VSRQNQLNERQPTVCISNSNCIERKHTCMMKMNSLTNIINLTRLNPPHAYTWYKSTSRLMLNPVILQTHTVIIPTTIIVHSLSSIHPLYGALLQGPAQAQRIRLSLKDQCSDWRICVGIRRPM